MNYELAEAAAERRNHIPFTPVRRRDDDDDDTEKALLLLLMLNTMGGS